MNKPGIMILMIVHKRLKKSSMVQCSFVEMLSHLKNRESTAALRPSSYDRRKRARIGDVVLILRTDTVLATTIADFDGLETRTGVEHFFQSRSRLTFSALRPCAA